MPREAWSLQVAEDLFDAVRSWIGSETATYAAFGHSAGAQFVHRLVMLHPSHRVSAAIAANAGWYTVPSFKLEYPYGISGLPVDRTQVEESLRIPLFLLLGENDTATDDPDLRRTPEAMAQGEHRLARGRHFYASAELAAYRWNTDLAWQLTLVPSVGHDQTAMAAAASTLLEGLTR